VKFLRDKGGLTAVEYIIVGAISLIVLGAALWQLAGSIAGRLNNFNGVL
jgi:Flp pilus assembly pilin Flp